MMLKECRAGMKVRHVNMPPELGDGEVTHITDEGVYVFYRLSRVTGLYDDDWFRRNGHLLMTRHGA